MELVNCPLASEKIDRARCVAAQRAEGAEEKCAGCSRYYKNTATYRLAEKLFATEGLIGKPTYHLDGDFITWHFHDKLYITASTPENGLGYIEINDGMMNLNPYAEEMYQNIAEIARGNVVVVTKIGVMGRYVAGIYPLELYEAKKKSVRFGIRTLAYTAKGEVN